MLLFQALKFLGHEVLHLLDVHSSPALWGRPHKVNTPEFTQEATHCLCGLPPMRGDEACGHIRGGPQGQQPGEPRRKAAQGLWPHIILGLQVPRLLAQETKDIGEVLIANLAEHL